MCESGFHACLDVLDCFDYYKPGKSVYCEVDLEGVTDETGNDTKRVGRKITIVRLLKDVTEICEAHEAYVDENAKMTIKDGPNSSASMGHGSSARMGFGSSVSMGHGSSARMSGNSSVSMGDGSSASMGHGSSVSIGAGSSVSMGFGSSASMGAGSSVSMGPSSAALIAANGKFRGGMWCVFAEPIRDNDGDVTGMACAVVDGKTILPDRWYHVVDGQFVECEGPEDE